VCVPNSSAQPRRQIKVERETPYSPMIWLCLCSVRLLSGHGKRGEDEGSLIVFIGSTLPCLCTLQLSLPRGAANDFKLISRYTGACDGEQCSEQRRMNNWLDSVQ